MVTIYTQTHKKFDMPKLLFILMLQYILLARIPIFCKQKNITGSVLENRYFDIYKEYQYLNGSLASLREDRFKELEPQYIKV